MPHVLSLRYMSPMDLLTSQDNVDDFVRLYNAVECDKESSHHVRTQR